MKTTYIIIFIVAIVLFFLISLIRRYNYAKAKGQHGEKCTEHSHLYLLSYLLFHHSFPPSGGNVCLHVEGFWRYATPQFNGDTDVCLGCNLQLLLHLPNA